MIPPPPRSTLFPYTTLFRSNVHPYLVEGVGEDFWPETFDRSVIDRWITVSDRDAFLTTRRLAQVEGIQRSIDRKSTRLNSSHVRISYAVFCLKKKKNNLYKL